LKKIFDLSTLDWRLSGWMPHFWRLLKSMELGQAAQAEVPAVPAKVPGSVQDALRKAGVIPDWNIGLQSLDCEWVEHRHWVFETVLPREWLTEDRTLRLRCEGLDYCGTVLLNGAEVGTFKGSLVPHSFDQTKHVKRDGDNRLFIVFENPPQWLGQIGFTSQMMEWKPRFNYGWDWIPRLVQQGIWDDITLEVSDGNELTAVRSVPQLAENGRGVLVLRGGALGSAGTQIRATLQRDGAAVHSETIPLKNFQDGIVWRDLKIDAWQPNGRGSDKRELCQLVVELLDAKGEVLDQTSRRVGFKRVRWLKCEGGENADPWLCEINGETLFLQGVNWTPIRPNFADVPVEEYRKRLELYRDLGCNLLRVWGGAYLEKNCFYDLCDELGLLVWQEFPLSSSGVDNWPPEDERAIEEMVAIAGSYIDRRQHHVSLTLWCGGNELQGALDGNKQGIGKPIDCSHPMIKKMDELVKRKDPTRRFLATSASGPRFMADEKDYGKNLHWDVHGPWNSNGRIEDEWKRYWTNDDALFRSESGHPGASSADLITAHLGKCKPLPASMDNPLWRRVSWWIQWADCIKELGHEPQSLDEYVTWSQQRQAEALAIAAESSKKRFPRCGGFLLWMGHDCYPCPINTAIIDYWGRPKPAALALAKVFKSTRQ
jgi:beta-mannosidase